MASKPKPNPNVVAIPEPLADEYALAYCVKALKESVDSLGGRRGQATDRAVTFNDLLNIGLVKEDATGSFTPSDELPRMDGSGPTMTRGVKDTGGASPGYSETYSRGDHIHPHDTTKLSLSGGTMLGSLLLAEDPLASNEAATRHYVDTSISGITGGTGGIPEAPIDANTYGRHAAGWYTVKTDPAAIDAGFF